MQTPPLDSENGLGQPPPFWAKRGGGLANPGEQRRHPDHSSRLIHSKSPIHPRSVSTFPSGARLRVSHRYPCLAGAVGPGSCETSSLPRVPRRGCSPRRWRECVEHLLALPFQVAAWGGPLEALPFVRLEELRDHKVPHVRRVRPLHKADLDLAELLTPHFRDSRIRHLLAELRECLTCSVGCNLLLQLLDNPCQHRLIVRIDRRRLPLVLVRRLDEGIEKVRVW